MQKLQVQKIFKAAQMQEKVQKWPTGYKCRKQIYQHVKRTWESDIAGICGLATH